MAKAGDTLGARYLLSSAVRETKHTVTFRAVDLRIGCEVDVEVMREGTSPMSREAKQLERDAELASEIAHPVVLAPRDVGVQEDATPYVVVARPRGETLDDRVCLSGVISTTDTIRIGLELLAALASAHDKDIMHGALGPEHVYLVERESILVSVHLSGFGGGSGRRDEEAPLGFSRLAFVPPERLDGGKVDASSDLYAVAGILWFALTGRSPRSIRSEGPLTAAEMPPHVRVLRKALRTDPTRRYQSARDMIHALLLARDTPAAVPRLSYVSIVSSDELTPTRHDPELLERIFARRSFVDEERTRTEVSGAITTH